MSEEKIKSCRICLKLIHDEIFHLIGKYARDTLDLLLIKLDLNVKEEPLMCANCADILEKCHSFKVGCLQTEDKLDRYTENGSEVDVRQVYLNENGNEDLTEVAEYQKICRLCLKSFSSADYLSLTKTDEDTILVKDIIQKYIPELDLTKTGDPTVCEPCHKCLQCYYILINNCVDVKEKMNKSCIVSREDEQQFTERRTNPNTLVKHEECSMLIKMEYSDDDKCADLVEEGSDSVDTSMPNLFIKNEEIKVEPEKGDYESSDWCQPKISEQANTSEDSTTPRCGRSRKRSQNSKKSFNSKLCKYKTTQGSGLKSHPCVHESLTEAKSFKCNVCTYHTKFSEYLERHLLLHKNPSELAKYKCKVCPYLTNYKQHFGRHMKSHKSPKEVQMYACENCSFQTKHRWYLKRHLVTHKSTLEVSMYKCVLCQFETKYKAHLTRHMLSHMSPSEVMMYKCTECPFQTKLEAGLKRHALRHKSDSEVSIYTCKICEYKTRYKQHLSRHKLSHMDISEVIKSIKDQK